MKKYKIFRNFFHGGSEVIERGLTLAEAKKHCQNPETSSHTATGIDEQKLTALRGKWFDGFDEE